MNVRSAASLIADTGVTTLKELVDLGRGCGFQVQAFQVVKDGHGCDTAHW